MNSNEWPLVFFTILSQISLGIILAAFIVSFVVKSTDTPAISEIKRLVVIAALSLMGIALILSFFHLASPQHSVYALSNAGQSWLSREIVLAMMYFFTLLIALSSLTIGVPHSNLFGYFFLTSLLVGVIMIWSMIRVYMIPTVPLWNSPSTAVSFYNTSLMLGGALVLIFVVKAGSRTAPLPESGLIQTVLFYMIAASVFIFLLNKLMLQPDIASISGGFAAPAISKWWESAQYVLLIIGFSLLTYWFATSDPVSGGRDTAREFLVYSAAACLLLAEIAGRYVFYASYYRIGV